MKMISGYVGVHLILREESQEKRLVIGVERVNGVTIRR